MRKNGINREKVVAGAGLFSAMAHPKRLELFELLKNDNGLCVTEIYERLGLDQASASNHLGILKRKGILESKREGKRIFYSLKHEKLKEIALSLDRILEA